ncbi:hypothetical protein [Glaciecola sp. MF2-115]|uniref:hypothetical protein n=1 Tax=Glaciecola sp. MF2-115 TaxID=3384827 RepID=UPI0039A3D745
MKFTLLRIIIAAMLVQPFAVLQAKEASNDCEQLIQKSFASQISAAKLFQNSQSVFVAVVCKEAPLPIYEVLYANMYSPEVLATVSPVVSFSKVKQVINPNGESKTTGILVADRTEEDQFTIKTRTRLATGEAIDINKQTTLDEGKFILFEDRGFSVGLLRLPRVKSK